MGLNLLYDTNTFIYFFNDQLINRMLFDKTFISENNIYISSISRIELLSFNKLSKNEKKIINLFLNEFTIIPVTKEIEDMCIEIRKKSGIKIPDAIILATAKFINAKIVTADEKMIKHFKKKDIINPLKQNMSSYK